jgi:ABC-type multidrug transport system fused ATPase/permease subunit
LIHLRPRERTRKPSYNTLQNVGYIVRGAWAEDKPVFLLFVACTILTAVSPFVSIFFNKWFLQELMGQQRMQTLITLLTGFLAVSAALAFLTPFARGLYHPRLIKIRFAFIRLHQDKCMSTDFQNTEDPKFLDEMQTSFRCLQSNNRGVEGVLHKLFTISGSLFAIFGYVAIVSSLSGWVLAYLVINVAVVYYLTFASRRYENSRKGDISDNDRRCGYLYEVMYNFDYGKELRVLGLRQWVAQMYQALKVARLDIDKDIKWRYFRARLVDTLLLLVREGVVYGYLIALVVQGRLDIPSFTMYVASVAGFATWLSTLTADLAEVRAQNLDICDLRHFLEKPERMTTVDPLPIPEGPYTIEFRNVSFRYPRSDREVYSGFNLTIRPGEKLGIVGHNGAGKTTFVKLLLRLYDVTGGEILLNGVNIKRFDPAAYRRLFSAVFQEIKPLAFSVAENVAAAPPDQFDRQRVQSALDKADVSQSIDRLKHGMDTPMLKILDSEGVAFSGGENQKIAIARALYKDAPVMIMDEPTAALDSLAEHAIYSRFSQMVAGKSAIYISHRLASTHFCDRIAMFEEGKLVEEGTHEELMALGGKYADMFAVQAKYYQKEGEVSA